MYAASSRTSQGKVLSDLIFWFFFFEIPESTKTMTAYYRVNLGLILIIHKFAKCRKWRDLSLYVFSTLQLLNGWYLLLSKLLNHQSWVKNQSSELHPRHLNSQKMQMLQSLSCKSISNVFRPLICLFSTSTHCTWKLLDAGNLRKNSMPNFKALGQFWAVIRKQNHIWLI